VSRQDYEHAAKSSDHAVKGKDIQRIGVTSDSEYAAAAGKHEAVAAHTVSNKQPEGSCCTMS
jgi:hypothetical protein